MSFIPQKIGLTTEQLSKTYAAPSRSDISFLATRSSQEEKSGLVDIAYGDQQHDQPRDYKRIWLELARGELTLYEYTGFGNTALSRGKIIESIYLDHITSFRRPVILGSLGSAMSEFSLLISRPRSSINEISTSQITTPLNATAMELTTTDTEFRSLHVRVPVETNGGASDWFFSFVTAVVVNVSSKREAPVASALTTWLRSQNPGFDGVAPTPVMTPIPTNSEEQQSTADLLRRLNTFKVPPKASFTSNEEDEEDEDEKCTSHVIDRHVLHHRETGSSTSSSPSPTQPLERKKSDDDGLVFGEFVEKVNMSRPILRSVKTFNTVITPSSTPISGTISSTTPKVYMPPHLRRQLSLNSGLDVLSETMSSTIPFKQTVRHSQSSVGIGQGHGLHGIFSSQGPRLRMEDAHIAVTDLQIEFEKRLNEKSNAENDFNEIESRFGGAMKYDARECTNQQTYETSHMKSTILTGTSLFAVFDGHGGVESSNYVQQNFTTIFCARLKELMILSDNTFSNEDNICEMIGKALTQTCNDLDKIFLRFAEEGTWKSGTTALIVVTRKGGRLIVASLGDSRAVLARPSHRQHVFKNTCICNESSDSLSKVDLLACMYSAEVMSSEHTPEIEKNRIIAAGGWVSIETEISFFKLQSMDASDPFVSRRLRQGKTLENRVSRLCGELGVSRSLGDADYKGKRLSSYTGWSWPSDRNALDRKFTADLVLGQPEIKNFQILEAEASIAADDNVPFMILACDGLWEVLSNEEAVCICAQYLKEHNFVSLKNLSDSKNSGIDSTPDSHVPVGAARRLAELALKLGTSDNLTVMVVLLN